VISYYPHGEPTQTTSSNFDPLDEIGNLQRDGKISAPEADRIRRDMSSGRMTAEQLRGYIRQKTR